jgi:hypothetical protein
MYNIAFLGKARSGKDTAGQWLVRERAYTRVAFADPLKEMALRIDPLIPTALNGAFRVHVRLSDLVADAGWEYSKATYPEVRRTLQRIGQTIREDDPDYWVNVARRKISAAEQWNMPVVVTDVRYPNEAEMLRSRGFRMVRIVRPGASAGEGAAHESENLLNDYTVDATVYNEGSVELLHFLISLV